VVLRHIAANVRKLRLRRGMTQEQLAEAAHVEARYVQDVERAMTNLSIDVLVALASALEVDERMLFRPREMASPKVGRPPAVRR
jgi:transcriptional regulator with XRE-family HTH domain